jgi:uncharacterized membrane protein YfcA
MLTAITPEQWVCLILGAAGIGISKAGFPGVSMLHVVMFAFVFGALASTGVLLPMLVVGDLCAIRFFGRSADWRHVRKLLPPTIAGILLGWLMMDRLDAGQFKLIVGGIILVLCGVQLLRTFRPGWFDTMPHQTWFAIVLGLLAGVTTMLANAAGPVVALYLLAVALPKWELIGTSAWLFLVLNVLKLPLSFQLGLIDGSTLLIGAILAPVIPLGMLGGRWLVGRVSQKWFNLILLGFTVVAAIRLIGWI